MATTTEELTDSTVYGLFHDEDLIYVGETTHTLQRRLTLHFAAARRGRDLRVYEYLSQIDDLREEVEIKELDYDSEAEALEEHDTLNDGRGGSNIAEPSWVPTDEELEIIEEKTLREAAEALDRGYENVRRVAKKLDLLEKNASTHLSDAEVRAIWTRYHAYEEASYESVAWRFDTNATTVGKIIRRETYQHVDLPSETAIEAQKTYTLDPADANHGNRVGAA